MGDLQQLRTHISNRLKDLRRKRGLTIEVLTGLADIDFSGYVYLEKGTKNAPRLEVLCKLARFYGVPLEYFFQDYKLSEEKLTKPSLLEKQMLAIFRKMKQENQFLCLRFFSNFRDK
jgi:transcriptional regulator with XRE-family HTH domain